VARPRVEHRGLARLIAGTEFFVAYQSEGPFRELLAIALLMTAVFAVVPDDAGTAASQPPAKT
jgi:hypothetical protein